MLVFVWCVGVFCVFLLGGAWGHPMTCSRVYVLVLVCVWLFGRVLGVCLCATVVIDLVCLIVFV